MGGYTVSLLIYALNCPPLIHSDERSDNRPTAQEPKIMTDRSNLDDFIQQLQKLFATAGDSSNLIKPKAQALISSFLAKQNIVTREEFDAQSAVLLRTREKLDQLEAQLSQLHTIAEQSKNQA